MGVYLVGAGPGAEGLITVRGLELLKQADVIIYDHLVSPTLLHYTRSDAELIYVGKQAGSHTLPQAEINALMLEKGRLAANSGGIVVRLKGGDPFLFGRGGEEMDALLQAGLDVEIVPGVSAAWAASAYAGIPLTHRGLASSVALITGQAGRGNAEPDWERLGRGADTLVVFMGMARLQEICRCLLASGLPASRPAALVEWGTLGRQRKLVDTLGSIAAAAAAADFSAPALLIVGEVAALGRTASWFEKKPLFNRTIAVTRSAAQAAEFSCLLQDLGAMPLELPVLTIKPHPPDAFSDAVLQRLGDYAWLVFTSANGVKYFWELLAARGLDSRQLGTVRVAAIGPGTAAALQERYIQPDFVPSVYVAEELASGLGEQLRNTGEKAEPVLILRGGLARPALEEGLRSFGIAVETLNLYDTLLPAEAAYASGLQELLAALHNNRLDAITFCSSSAVDNFFRLLAPEALAGKELCLACIGPITAERLKKYGLTCTVQADEYTLPGLAKALVAYFSSLSGGGCR